MFISGYFTSHSISIGSITLNGNLYNQPRPFIAKFDSLGHACWAQSLQGNIQDYPSYRYGLAIDTFQNIYFTGYFRSPNFSIGTFVLNSPGISHLGQIFLAKYDTSGQVVFASSIGGNGDDQLPYVTIDSKNNLYLTGWFNTDSFALGNDSLIGTGMFLSKLGENQLRITNIIDENEFSIYPNPSNGEFFLKVPENSREIIIRNILGQKIKQYHIKFQEKINLEINSQGIFFIQLITNKGIITKKIIINR